MKKLIFKSFLLATSLCLGISTFAMEVHAEDVDQSTYQLTHQSIIQNDSNSEEGIVPYADIIEWRYKVENGRLYRRQYNYSKEQWIGEWELC